MDLIEEVNRSITSKIEAARLLTGLSVEDIAAVINISAERVNKVLITPLNVPGADLMAVIECLKVKDEIIRMLPTRGGAFGVK